MASGTMLMPAVMFAPAAGAQPVASSATPAATSACSTSWGTGAKGPAALTLSRTTLKNVRAGQHPCFDRIVVDVSSQLSHRGYRVGYVSAVHQEGSGNVVALRGRAKLEVVVGAPAYDSKGRSTYKPRNPRELVRASALRAVKQVAWAGSFEGQSTMGVGVDRRRPFRVYVLDSRTAPDRLVIDIANH
ncbi:MAG: hypothetical protein Q4P32_12920 [Micrococcales bacterium]|nr:hypothetical protein [Micrococcales bacterium]